MKKNKLFELHSAFTLLSSTLTTCESLLMKTILQFPTVVSTYIFFYFTFIIICIAFSQNSFSKSMILNPTIKSDSPLDYFFNFLLIAICIILYINGKISGYLFMDIYITFQQIIVALDNIKTNK